MTTLITGATRGIGAELLAQLQSRGDAVIGTCRTAPPDGNWIKLDVTQSGDFDALGAQIDGKPLELLVCNAGVYLDKGHPLDTGYPEQMWADSFATNVTGVFRTIQALLPNIRAAQGKIAIISSQMASQERAPGGSYIYRASKAAVLNLGRNLAADLHGEGIAVGIYHPGWVQTDMGGSSASLTARDAAQGLIERFDHLSLATTGCFETWDGQAHPY